MIKKFAKVSPCCICGGIPSLEVFMMKKVLQGLKGIANIAPIEYFQRMQLSKFSNLQS